MTELLSERRSAHILALFGTLGFVLTLKLLCVAFCIVCAPPQLTASLPPSPLQLSEALTSNVFRRAAPSPDTATKSSKTPKTEALPASLSKWKTLLEYGKKVAAKRYARRLSLQETTGGTASTDHSLEGQTAAAQKAILKLRYAGGFAGVVRMAMMQKELLRAEVDKGRPPAGAKGGTRAQTAAAGQVTSPEQPPPLLMRTDSAPASGWAARLSSPSRKIMGMLETEEEGATQTPQPRRESEAESHDGSSGEPQPTDDNAAANAITLRAPSWSVGSLIFPHDAPSPVVSSSAEGTERGDDRTWTQPAQALSPPAFLSRRELWAGFAAGSKRGSKAGQDKAESKPAAAFEGVDVTGIAVGSDDTEEPVTAALRYLTKLDVAAARKLAEMCTASHASIARKLLSDRAHALRMLQSDAKAEPVFDAMQRLGVDVRGCMHTLAPHRYPSDPRHEPGVHCYRDATLLGLAICVQRWLASREICVLTRTICWYTDEHPTLCHLLRMCSASFSSFRWQMSSMTTAMMTAVPLPLPPMSSQPQLSLNSTQFIPTQRLRPRNRRIRHTRLPVKAAAAAATTTAPRSPTTTPVAVEMLQSLRLLNHPSAQSSGPLRQDCVLPLNRGCLQDRSV